MLLPHTAVPSSAIRHKEVHADAGKAGKIAKLRIAATKMIKICLISNTKHPSIENDHNKAELRCCRQERETKPELSYQIIKEMAEDTTKICGCEYLFCKSELDYC
jgi:hypothetical protein